MSCIASPIVAPNESVIESLVKPHHADPAVTKCRFTVSHTSRAAGAAPQSATCTRADMAEQKTAVQLERQESLSAFIAAHESAAVMTENDRRASTLMLLYMAAQRDVDLARVAEYPSQVVDYMQQTWCAFISQAKEFYETRAMEACAEEPSTMELSRTALEYISSIGIWFSGQQISLPLRRYTVQVMGADETLQNITAVGLLSFAYSTYVMQLRAMSQQSTLESLARIQEQLGAKTLFIPQLLVALS